MSQRPKILISISQTTNGKDYAEAIAKAGGKPHLAYCYRGKESFAALLLAGGGDLAPIYFGEEDHGSHPPDPLRDETEIALCEEFVIARKPILGICRGCQILNVYFGGTLIQDLPSYHHHLNTCHSVVNIKNSIANALFGKEMLVRSNHHQAIGKLGKGIRITQYARRDSVIEGFAHKSLPILATQWHPEKICTDVTDTAPLFQHFLSLCEIQKTR